jgi:tetratricopeptide (TPR) repeat protein
MSNLSQKSQQSKAPRQSDPLMSRSRFLSGTIAVVVFVAAAFGLHAGWNKLMSAPLVERHPWAMYSYRVAPLLNFQNAVSFYEKRMKENPHGGLDRAYFAQALISEAKITGDVTLYDKAQMLAEESLKIFPAMPYLALLDLASVAQARHQFKEAVALAEKVLEKKPNDLGAMNVLLTSYLGMGDLEKANEYADRLLDNRQTLESMTMRALVLSARGRDREALYYFKRGFDLEEDSDTTGSAWARTMLGRFYMNHGDYPIARGLYLEALRIMPGSFLAKGLLAQLEFQDERYNEADRLFDEAFQTSNEPSFLLGRAKVKVALGDTSGAHELWSRAEGILRTELAKSSYGHRITLVKLLTDRAEGHDLDESLKLIDEEAKVRRTAEVIEAWSEIYAKQAKWGQALELSREALRTGVANAEYFYRAGQIEQKIGHNGWAVFYYHRALETDVHYEPAREAFSRYHLTRAKMAELDGLLGANHS